MKYQREWVPGAENDDEAVKLLDTLSKAEWNVVYNGDGSVVLRVMRSGAWEDVGNFACASHAWDEVLSYRLEP